MINVISNFVELYENVEETVDNELSEIIGQAILRAVILSDQKESLTRLTVKPKARIDK
ncbi:MAG: hypothetical protein HRK26_04435 [Rickettsiaceae bacterium H1]|nr:hypothetical protein [Rickettsiaceae bacterium H1]